MGSRITKGSGRGNAKLDERCWDLARSIIGCLDLSDIFALHLRPLHLPFVSKYSEKRIRNDLGQPETPDKGDGIEEVGVARTCVYPEIVEGRAQQGRVQDRGHGEEGVPHHCRISVWVNFVEAATWGGPTREDMSIQW